MTRLIIIDGGGGSSDPYAAYRTFLAHGDGTDTSTTIRDEVSGNNGTLTGSPNIRTDGAALGGATMRYYQGASSYAEWTRTGGYVTQAQWTLEFIIEVLENNVLGAGTNYNTVIAFDNNGTGWQRIAGSGPGGTSISIFGNDFNISTGRNYVMVSQDTSNLYIYVNGSRVSSNASASQVGTHTKIVLGCINEILNGTSYSHGANLEEVRVTDGLCLQTGTSYTVQSEAFPNP